MGFINRHRTTSRHPGYTPTGPAAAPQRPQPTPAAPTAQPLIARDGLTLSAAGDRATLTVDRPRVQGHVTGQVAADGTVTVAGQAQAQLREHPIAGTAQVQVAPGGATDVAVRAQGQLRQAPVTAAVDVHVKPAGEQTRVDVAVAAESGARGGVGVNVQVQAQQGLAPGRARSIQTEVSVGPDVLREVRGMAYQQTRQAIRERRIPEIEVPAVAQQALKKLGSLNQEGGLTGAVQVYMSDPALLEAVRQGVTRMRGKVRRSGRRRIARRPRGSMPRSRLFGCSLDCP